ncbi:MAG: AAA family ATPase [Saprospirales bacterium]|nr:AAA family ATPase [Saprospirales bacterium]
MPGKNQHPELKKYKFRELKLYSSTEWLADNKKKYRQVFDRWNTAYVYAELSFYNKFFDEEDWDVNVQLRCYAVKKNKRELCKLDFSRKVTKYDNVVYIREGWGNKKPGSFWKKGTYCWEAYIEDEKVATRYFYIEDSGSELEPVSLTYLELQGIRLYEGPYDDVIEEDRVYYKTFDESETRYVYAELLLKNLRKEPWQCELFIKFYNDARELKGQVVRLNSIDAESEYFTLTAGWGSNVKGSWREGRYTCEVVFMDRLLAVLPFEVYDEFEEGINPIYLPGADTNINFVPQDDPSETLEVVMKELDKLVGLAEVKRKVHEHAQYIQFLQLRKEKGFPEKERINLHSVFIGNPGTGKTTVAGMMGKLYRKMGLLSRGHVHVVDRSDLVGEYIGQTAPKVKAAIEKARGGVLLIDEAYSLARSKEDSKDFGREVIEILIREMSDGPGDMAVIATGYPKEMANFLDSNPGLKSRFKHSFEFADYLPQELSQIADIAAEKMGVKLSEAAKKRIDDIIVNAYRDRDRTFGNARFVFDLIEKAKVNLGLRVMATEDPKSLERAQLEEIELQDVENIDIKPLKALPHIPIDEALLEESMEELRRLIGLEKIKQQIEEHVQLVRYHRETGRDVLNRFYMHTALIGNPGTGKTTVARILTKIYKALGILERGHMVETDRHGLVAGFVGQTAIKTAEKIDEAMGGVLFIDEAYSLTMRSGGNDFGDEAIQTILKRMEDNRGHFFVFVAGYPDNMEAFLKANPGLSSRFDKILKFEDYNPEDLYRIAMQMFEEMGVVVAPEAQEHLDKYFKFLYRYRDKYFGNARTVRQLVAEAIKNQNLRLAALTPEERENITSNVLVLDDVAEFKMDSSGFIFNKRGIGFRRSDD